MFKGETLEHCAKLKEETSKRNVDFIAWKGETETRLQFMLKKKALSFANNTEQDGTPQTRPVRQNLQTS